MVPSQVPFSKGAVAYTFTIHTLNRRLGEYVQGIKEYARSCNDKIAAKDHAQKIQPFDCKHLPSSKRSDATANCVLIINAASIIRCLTLHRSPATWCHTTPADADFPRTFHYVFPGHHKKPPHFALFELRDLLSIEPQTPVPKSTQSQHLHCSCPPATVSHRPSFLWYDMLGLDIFAVLIKADHVDMVVRPMFKLASSKISTVSVSSTLTKHSPHDRFRRIRGQHLIAILDNTNYPGFGCVDMFLASFKRLCLGRCFEYKPLGGLLNCG